MERSFSEKGKIKEFFSEHESTLNLNLLKKNFLHKGKYENKAEWY